MRRRHEGRHSGERIGPLPIRASRAVAAHLTWPYTWIPLCERQGLGIQCGNALQRGQRQSRPRDVLDNSSQIANSPFPIQQSGTFGAGRPVAKQFHACVSIVTRFLLEIACRIARRYCFGATPVCWRKNREKLPWASKPRSPASRVRFVPCCLMIEIACSMRKVFQYVPGVRSMWSRNIEKKRARDIPAWRAISLSECSRAISACIKRMAFDRRKSSGGLPSALSRPPFAAPSKPSSSASIRASIWRPLPPARSRPIPAARAWLVRSSFSSTVVKRLVGSAPARMVPSQRRSR